MGRYIAHLLVAVSLLSAGSTSTARADEAERARAEIQQIVRVARAYSESAAGLAQAINWSQEFGRRSDVLPAAEHFGALSASDRACVAAVFRFLPRDILGGRWAAWATDFLGGELREGTEALLRAPHRHAWISGLALIEEVGAELMDLRSPAMALAASEGDEELARSALGAIRRLGAGAAELAGPVSTYCVSPHPPSVQLAATWTLAEIAPRSRFAIAVLRAALRDEEAELAHTRLIALGPGLIEHISAEFAPLLAQAVVSDSEWIGESAVRLASGLEDRVKTELIAPVLKEFLRRSRPRRDRMLPLMVALAKAGGDALRRALSDSLTDARHGAVFATALTHVALAVMERDSAHRLLSLYEKGFAYRVAVLTAIRGFATVPSDLVTLVLTSMSSGSVTERSAALAALEPLESDALRTRFQESLEARWAAESVDTIRGILAALLTRAYSQDATAWWMRFGSEDVRDPVVTVALLEAIETLPSVSQRQLDYVKRAKSRPRGTVRRVAYRVWYVVGNQLK